MDFLDIIAAAIIGTVVFVCSYLYYHFFLIDILIKWKGVQTTGVVVNSEAAKTRSPTVSAPLYAHYITYEFTDTAGRKWTKTKRVRTHHRLAGVVKGTKLPVYYLPERPDKSALG